MEKIAEIIECLDEKTYNELLFLWDAWMDEVCSYARITRLLKKVGLTMEEMDAWQDL